MKKVLAIGAVSLALATTVLWLRIRELEKSVDTLTRQLQAQPKAIPAVSSQPAPQPAEEKQRNFKLIESPSTNGETEIGVPWSVERGTIIDAAERMVPMPHVETHPPDYKIEGAPPFDLPSNEWRLEKPPTGSTSDGGTH